MIRRLAFKHGWWYHYRVNEENLSRLCDDGLAPLQTFLLNCFDGVPDEKFMEGPRSSSLRFPVESTVLPAAGHPLCTLTQASGAAGRTAHTTLQKALLDTDPLTIATEIPLWLDEGEHDLMQQFEEPGALTGHIDLLRVEDGKVWVWDYKPKAAKEKWAATQVWTYAQMLSARTGLPLSAFRCGWFDEQDAYVFKP